MNADRFNQILNDQLERVNEILGSKAGEYASDKDRLHNFKKAAALQGGSPLEALRGMMTKHTISIYDMLEADPSGLTFSIEKWDEKITDHINYLILMRALLVEIEDEDVSLGTNGTD